MDLDKLNFLPEWQDDDDEEGEAWKVREEKEAAKALYAKWREVYALVNGFMDQISDVKKDESASEMAASTQEMIRSNVLIISAKIHASSRTPLYILKMEGAAIIRQNAIALMEQVRFAHLMDLTEEAYCDTISEEMDLFRSLFKAWVATFRKDEYEDEWGLF